MQIRQLTLEHVRVFEQTTFDFQPGMNLIVGINGAGKSTVLDVLRIILSNVLPKFTVSQNNRISLEKTDLKLGHRKLAARLKFTASNIPFECVVEKKGVQKIAYDLKYDLSPKNENILDDSKSSPEQPLAIYFSPHRSFPDNASLSKQKSEGGQIVAFADALIQRELRIGEFAAWWLAQNTLATKDNQMLAKQHIATLQNAVTRFLETCSNVQAVKKPRPTLLLDKEGTKLDVRQLSDGERGVLSIILDLARRLSQANPKLDDPLKDGKAVVLIDELDLHLHPGWQRTIVEKLTRTFPNCQFIATTHSPLILGEVKPQGLTLIRKEGNEIIVEQGIQGYGLDASYILKHLMGTASRTPPVQAQIDRVEDALEEGELDIARIHLAELRKMIHGDDDEVMRLEASINNLEALADEMD